MDFWLDSCIVKTQYFFEQCNFLHCFFIHCLIQQKNETDLERTKIDIKDIFFNLLLDGVVGEYTLYKFDAN